MRDYILVNPKTILPPLNDTDSVSFVPMTNVQEKNNVVYFDCVPYQTVKKGFTVFKKGDMLWAKITPCMQNGKSCMTDTMPTAIGFGSTEFHVIRKQDDSVYLPFLWAVFSNDNVLKAAQATFSGSAGQQRVSASFLESFPAVLPKYDKQIALVETLEQKLAIKNQKFSCANQTISNFEKSTEVLCGLQNSDDVPFYGAVPYGKLDGVIDVKRYLTPKRNCPLQVSDVCDIVEEKVNISALGSQTVDWIRIDDLPNKPLEIETVRTQPANEIQGSFFLVQAGDILVARLGPTILNQKIVLVQQTERTTIASAEFLVLRCKSGFEPEAVMAVLKTPYFSNLMYAHSRGSTPSRYRLNREDMLKLPFPDIADIQSALASQAVCLREQIKTLRQQAEQEWQAAKEQFEKELLGESYE